MKITCKKCGKEYNIKEEFIKKGDLKMRCRGCGEVIVVKKADSVERGPGTVAAAPSAAPKKTDEAYLPVVKSGSGVEEFDLDSAPISVPPVKPKKTILGASVPPPPEPVKGSMGMDDPFADLPAAKTPKGPGREEFEPHGVERSKPEAAGLPAPGEGEERKGLGSGPPQAGGDLPALKKEDPHGVFRLDVSRPAPEKEVGGDLPAPRETPAAKDLDIGLPPPGTQPSSSGLPRPKEPPSKEEVGFGGSQHKSARDMDDLPVPYGGKEQGLDFGLDLPRAKAGRSAEPPEPDMEGKRGRAAPDRMEEDIPAVLSPSSLPPEAKRKRKDVEDPFGGLDLPAKKPAGGAPAGTGERGRGGEDVFGSLDMPPSGAGAEGLAEEPEEKMDIKPAKEKLEVERSKKFVGQAGGTAFGEIELGEAPEPGKGEAKEGAAGMVDLPEKKHRGAEAAGEDLAGEALVEVDSAAAEEMVRKREKAKTGEKGEKAPAGGWKVTKGGKGLVTLLVVLVLAGAGVAAWQTGAYMTAYKYFAKYVMGEDIDAYFASRDRTIAEVEGMLKGDEYSDYLAAIGKLKQMYDGKRDDDYLAAYLSYLISLTEMRFGKEEKLDQLGESLLSRVPSENEFPLTHAMAASLQKILKKVKAEQALASLNAQYQNNPRDSELLHLLALANLYLGEGGQAVVLYGKLAKLEGDSRRSSFGRIRAIYADGDAERGDELLSAFIEKNPGFAEAKVLKAMRLAKIGSLSQATSLVENIRKSGNVGEYLEIPMRVVEGIISLKNEEYQEARDVFDEILEREPMNVEALVCRGKIDLYEGNPAKALGRFNLAVGADPRNDEASFGIVESHIRLDQYKEAKVALESLHERFKDDWRLDLYGARLSKALGDEEEAEERFKKAVEKNPMNVDGYIELASLYFGQGRHLEAIGMLEEARNKLPVTAKLLTAFARGRVNRGEYEKAYEELTEALNKDPRYIHAQYLMGVTLHNLGNNEEALRHFDKVSEGNPSYPGLDLYYGLIFEDMGEVEKALKYYNQAMEKEPDDENVLLRSTAIYVNNKKYVEARSHVERILKLNPGNTEGIYYMGRVLLGENQHAEALHHFERAIKLNPNVGLYYLWAGIASERMDNYTDALKYSMKALEKDENLAEAYLLRGKLRTRMGMIKDAGRDLRKAMELKPGLTEAWGSLGVVYEEQRKFGDAVAAYNKYLEEYAGDFEIQTRLGLILYDRGELKEARKHFLIAEETAREAGSHSKWRFTSLFYLGAIAEREGNDKKAVEHYEAYMKDAPEGSIDRQEVQSRLHELTQ